MSGLRRLALLVALAALSACATRPPAPTRAPYRPRPVERSYQHAPEPPPAAPAPAGEDIPLSALPGWYAEDYAAALRAFAAGCTVTRDIELAAICQDARQAEPLGQDEACAFLERHFRARRIGDEGVLTAYFAPEYEARLSPEPPFTAPVRPKPSGLEALQPMGDRAAPEASVSAHG